jgi:hypothetical protein
MTGYVVRVRRGGRWVNVDFDELHDHEFDQVMLPRDDGWMWAVALAKWIRDHVGAARRDGADLRLFSVADQAAGGDEGARTPAG